MNVSQKLSTVKTSDSLLGMYSLDRGIVFRAKCDMRRSRARARFRIMDATSFAKTSGSEPNTGGDGGGD
jgi:hypothetical protein